VDVHQRIGTSGAERLPRAHHVGFVPARKLRVIMRQHLDGRLTVIRPPDVPLAYTVITRERAPVTLPRSLPRRRRQTGLGRWPKPEVQFASLFPKRTDHVSNS